MDTQLSATTQHHYLRQLSSQCSAFVQHRQLFALFVITFVAELYHSITSSSRYDCVRTHTSLFHNKVV